MEHHLAGCFSEFVLEVAGVTWCSCSPWLDAFSGFVGLVWFVLGTLLRGDQDSP